MQKTLFLAAIVGIVFLSGCTTFPPVEPPQGATLCTEPRNFSGICTMELRQVCGSDGQTYGNSCGACSNPLVQYYFDGQCINQTGFTQLFSELIIPEQSKSCSADTDCLYVSVNCSDCKYDLINKAFRDQYTAKKEAMCTNYRGTMCGVGLPEIGCVDNKCQIIGEPKNPQLKNCESDSDCPQNSICYNSMFCGLTPDLQNPVSCGPQEGDLKCHQLCESDSDCPSITPECKQVDFKQGDAIAVKKICAIPENSPSPSPALEEYYASIDYSCYTDSDCEVKDVHNCCGFYPGCANKNAITDPDKVREICASEGLSSVCGFPTIYACECVQNKCEGILEQTRIETQGQCLQAGGFWREQCGLIQDCCNFKTTDFGQACSDNSQCQGTCLVETPESTSGTCSQWKTQFGCYDYLYNGQVMSVCVD